MTHGTRSSYVRGCRCDACRAATTAYQKQWRRANLQRRIVDVDRRDVAPVRSDRHGRLATYTNLGCRCEKCATAAREYSRQYTRDYRRGVRRRSSSGLTPSDASVGVPA